MNNRTGKVFRNKFKEPSKKMGGVVGGGIYITNPNRKEIIEEGNLRKEIQNIIKAMVQEQNSTEQIKNFLDKEEYKSYQEHIDLWITGWILRLNPNIKSIMVKALNRDKGQEQIRQEIMQENKKIYELYEISIQKFIENEKESRQKKREKAEKSEDEGR